MSDPWINGEEPRLVVGLGDDAQDGPKLSIEVALFAALIFLFFSVVLYGALPAPESQRGGYLIYLVGMTGFCLVLQHEYQPRLRQFGLSRGVLWSKRTLAWVGPGLALAGAELGFIYGPGYLMSFMGPSHHTFTPGLQPLSRIVRQPFHQLIFAVIGPILEELLFRGYLYLLFRQNWGRRWAALISSAIFAAGHLGNILVLVDAFWVSLVDIYLDNKARSLAPSMADHVVYNLVLSCDQVCGGVRGGWRIRAVFWRVCDHSG